MRPRVAHASVWPDHIHAIWTLPEGDADFSMRWRLIKIVFPKSMPKTERLSKVRRARGERGIWQRRFREHLIRDDEDYGRHVEYCYINPVKHGLVTRVRDWPFSSFHRDGRPACFRKTGRASRRRWVNSARRQWRNKAIAPYDILRRRRSGNGTSRHSLSQNIRARSGNHGH
jgi:REP element-mobilizing transposase RayT